MGREYKREVRRREVPRTRRPRKPRVIDHLVGTSWHRMLRTRRPLLLPAAPWIARMLSFNPMIGRLGRRNRTRGSG